MGVGGRGGAYSWYSNGNLKLERICGGVPKNGQKSTTCGTKLQAARTVIVLHEREGTSLRNSKQCLLIRFLSQALFMTL
jgi:hypothetical protein